MAIFMMITLGQSQIYLDYLWTTPDTKLFWGVVKAPEDQLSSVCKNYDTIIERITWSGKITSNIHSTSKVWKITALWVLFVPLPIIQSMKRPSQNQNATSFTGAKLLNGSTSVHWHKGDEVVCPQVQAEEPVGPDIKSWPSLTYKMMAMICSNYIVDLQKEHRNVQGWVFQGRASMAGQGGTEMADRSWKRISPVDGWANYVELSSALLS